MSLSYHDLPSLGKEKATSCPTRTAQKRMIKGLIVLSCSQSLLVQCCWTGTSRETLSVKRANDLKSQTTT